MYLYTSWCDPSFVQYVEKNFKITTQNIRNNVRKFDQLASKFDAMIYSDYKGVL